MNNYILYILYTLIGIAGIDLMILVHEFGHMICAKKCNVDVEVMQIGFGKSVFLKEIHGTKYSIGIIPFGGFCRMKGSEDIRKSLLRKSVIIENCEYGSLYYASALKRFLIYLCGPLSNIMLCIICYFIFFSMPEYVSTSGTKVAVDSSYATLYDIKYSTPASVSGLTTGDTVYSVNGKIVKSFYDISRELAQLKEEKKDAVLNTSSGTYTLIYQDNSAWGILPFFDPIVCNLNENSPEYLSGIRNNDVIKKINGNCCTNYLDILLFSENCNNISAEVERDGNIFKANFNKTKEGIGFSPLYIEQKINGLKLNNAIIKASKQLLENTSAALFSIKSILHGSRDKDSVAGVFSASYKMGTKIADSFSHGLVNGTRAVFFLLGSVSLSIAIANTIPIPALDGGLMLVCVVEMIIGRTLNPRTYTVLQTIGLILISIMLVAINLL